MPEQVEAWWARRQRSKGVDVPYPIGRYREEWQYFPALIRQYHPDLNRGIALTQVPPAADVYLVWQCDVGHCFVATPAEQRARPTGSRRRSTWCPECAELALGRTPVGLIVPKPDRPSIAREPDATAERWMPPPKARKRPKPLCERSIAARLDPGTAFASECAPKPASAVESDLRARLAERLEFTAGFTAIRVARPFFSHVEVWPDIILDELRVAIEYDSTGRDGLEHVGSRETIDARKDRLLRAVGWEVIRIRTGKLPTLGPHDLSASAISGRLVDRVLDELRVIRGGLLVDCYLR